MAEVAREISVALRENGIIGNAIGKVEAITRIKREVFLVAFIVITLFLFLLNLWGRRMAHVITTVWPVLGSLRAMDKGCVESQTKWLGYWIIYCAVNSFDFVFLQLEKKIKRIFIIKLILLSLCAMPHSKCGGDVIYHKALHHRVYKGPADSGPVPPKMEKMAEKHMEKAVDRIASASHMATAGSTEAKPSGSKEKKKEDAKKPSKGGGGKKGHK